MDAPAPVLPGMSLRYPPTNLPAEQQVLGAILANNRAFGAVAEFLKPDHFADPANARIYRECANLIVSGSLADAVTLKTRLLAAGELEEVGGMDYVAQLLAGMVSPRMAAEYGRAVHEAWLRREIIAAGEAMVEAAFDGAEPTEATLATAVGAIDRVLTGTHDGHGTMSLDEATLEAMRAADEAATRDGPPGVSTGFAALDEMLGGLEPATLTLLGARPGMGKTALALQIALAAARPQVRPTGTVPGVGVLFVSLEMKGRELGRRALAAAAQVHVLDLKKGRHGDHIGKLLDARRELARLPVSISDMSGQSVAVISLKARAVRRKHGLGLIIVDHVHIVRAEDADARHGGTYAVGKVSNALKRLAKDLDVPVLALCQLNRAVEGRDDKRPGLSDLRQAGDLEQDADAVAFVYRQEYYLGKGEPERISGEYDDKHARRVREWHEAKERCAGLAEVIVSKVRDGETGIVPLRWNAVTTSFFDPITELDA